MALGRRLGELDAAEEVGQGGLEAAGEVDERAERG